MGDDSNENSIWKYKAKEFGFCLFYTPNYRPVCMTSGNNANGQTNSISRMSGKGEWVYDYFMLMTKDEKHTRKAKH